jgi:uncharacterized membrane protein YhaH (DUF805 family)
LVAAGEAASLATLVTGIRAKEANVDVAVGGACLAFFAGEALFSVTEACLRFWGASTLPSFVVVALVVAVVVAAVVMVGLPSVWSDPSANLRLGGTLGFWSTATALLLVVVVLPAAGTTLRRDEDAVLLLDGLAWVGAAAAAFSFFFWPAALKKLRMSMMTHSAQRNGKRDLLRYVSVSMRYVFIRYSSSSSSSSSSNNNDRVMV